MKKRKQKQEAVTYTIEGRLLTSKVAPLRYEERTIRVTRLYKELFDELERCGFIRHLKLIPQYGSIKVHSKYDHTRFDYVCQQVFLHDQAKKTMKSDHMDFSYNNMIHTCDGLEFSLYDAVIILALVSNIGHFGKTFTSSKAAIRICQDNDLYREMFLSAVTEERYRLAAESALQSGHDAHLHLINALILLGKCNQDLNSVRISRELLYMYLGQQNSIPDEKKETILYVYRQIRDIAYLQSDLPCAAVPTRLITEEKALNTLLRQLLSRFNDTEPAREMIRTMKKLLDDAFYHDPAICFRNEGMIREMVRKAAGNNEAGCLDWADLILNEESVFNMRHHSVRVPVCEAFLKMSFPTGMDMESVNQKLNSIRGVFVASYARADGKYTVLAGMHKKTEAKAKKAFRMLQAVSTRYLNEKDEEDKNVLLATKFFLQNLFGKSTITINAYGDDGACLYVTRGYAARIKLLNGKAGQIRDNQDQRHEVEVIREYLLNDSKNDLCISIPSSIKVFEEQTGKTIAEFDGMLIFPNRKESQVIFFEAKNRQGHKTFAKNELIDKFEKLGVKYNPQEMIVVNRDVWMPYSI